MKFDYDSVKEEYLTVTDKDDDEMRHLKECLMLLTAPERKILITYIHFGRYTDVAAQYNVSPPTAKTYLNKVKNKLLSLMGNVERPYLD